MMVVSSAPAGPPDIHAEWSVVGSLVLVTVREGGPFSGMFLSVCQPRLLFRKILLCTPTCLADLDPTQDAISEFEFGPYLERPSRNRSCSLGVHSLEVVSPISASAARLPLAAAACRFHTCWLRERLLGYRSPQN